MAAAVTTGLFTAGAGFAATAGASLVAAGAGLAAVGAGLAADLLADFAGGGAAAACTAWTGARARAAARSVDWRKERG